MIVSIGIDIIEVYRIEETLARTPRFVDAAAVFTEAERAYCDVCKGVARAQSYAARFAAKEGLLKSTKDRLGVARSHGTISRSQTTRMAFHLLSVKGRTVLDIF